MEKKLEEMTLEELYEKALEHARQRMARDAFFTRELLMLLNEKERMYLILYYHYTKRQFRTLNLFEKLGVTKDEFFDVYCGGKSKIYDYVKLHHIKFFWE